MPLEPFNILTCWLTFHLTDRCSHSVALRVDETSDLCEVAVPLADVLDAGGLHQHGVVCRQDSGDAFLVVLNQCCVLPAAHESPHLFIGGDLWFLTKRKHLVRCFMSRFSSAMCACGCRWHAASVVHYITHGKHSKFDSMCGNLSVYVLVYLCVSPCSVRENRTAVVLISSSWFNLFEPSTQPASPYPGGRNHWLQSGRIKACMDHPCWATRMPIKWVAMAEGSESFARGHWYSEASCIMD